MSDAAAGTTDVLTVAEAAARLGTTIPRLRRLLARPDMATCSRQEAIETKRGTRTGKVVLVSEMAALKAALSMGTSGPSIQEQKQTRLRTFSETEVLALQTTLRRTEELLQSKDNELAAKDEIITLLKEKIEGLNRVALADGKAVFQEREQERRVPVSETMPEAHNLPAGDTQAGLTGVSGTLTPPKSNTGHSEAKSEAKAAGSWARFLDWFQNK